MRMKWRIYSNKKAHASGQITIQDKLFKNHVGDQVNTFKTWRSLQCRKAFKLLLS